MPMNINVINWIFEHRWAIAPHALETIIEIAARNNDLNPEIISKAIHGSIWEKYVDAEGKISDFWALEGFDYPILEGSRRVSVAGNVAILPVIGPIFPRANLMTMSGGASVQSLSYDFNLALENRDIKSIILNIDSPGGEITGIGEFADMVFSSQAKKTIISYVYGSGASAAYWIASAGSEIIISNTGEVGSIGVVAAYTSRKRMQEKAGIDNYEIISSQSPNKRPDPGTEQGKNQIQAIVDQLADIFISSVARNRGIKSDEVIKGYGQGGMFVGNSAIEKGLADRLGSLEGIIKEMQEIHKSSNFFSGGSFMTLQELKSQHPDTYAEAVSVGRKEAEKEAETKISAARKEGAEAESSRIKAIEAIDVPGAEAIVKENKFDMTKTADAVSSLILKSQKDALDKMQANISKDGKSLADQSAGLGTGGSQKSQDDQEVVKAMVDGMNSYQK